MNNSKTIDIGTRRIDRTTIALTSFYILISATEIFAEYLKDTQLIYLTKPFILPTLILIYYRNSPRTNYIFILALVFSWIANIFFIKQTFLSIFTGAIFFFFYRSLIIYIVLKHVRLPGIFPVIVGCMPFFFVYMYLINLTYELLGDGLLIFVIQCIIISLLGGLSVGNFMLRSNRAAVYLLFSTLLFAMTQFIFVIRLYYTSINIFQPVAMLLFVVAQYIFYRFMILSENEKLHSGDHNLTEIQ